MGGAEGAGSFTHWSNVEDGEDFSAAGGLFACPVTKDQRKRPVVEGIDRSPFVEDDSTIGMQGSIDPPTDMWVTVEFRNDTDRWRLRTSSSSVIKSAGSEAASWAATDWSWLILLLPLTLLAPEVFGLVPCGRGAAACAPLWLMC